MCVLSSDWNFKNVFGNGGLKWDVKGCHTSLKRRVKEFTELSKSQLCTLFSIASQTSSQTIHINPIKT